MVATLYGRAGRALAVALVLAVVAPTLGLVPEGSGLLPGAEAVEFPTDGSAAGWNIQTNGPAASSTLGDWYTSSAGGNQDHYLAIVVPCEWPAGTPIHVDLYSPEVNANGADVGDLEEPTTLGTTSFGLYGPYDDRSVADVTRPVSGGLVETTFAAVPAGGADPGWVRFATIDVASTGCGIFLLRSGFVEDTATDQNGWRLRIGEGALGGVLTSDADGIPGTNDELLVGVYETTFQHDGGTGGCLSLYEYVGPAQTEARFHNFDMDGNVSVAYESPSGTPFTGTVSGNDVWNNGRTGGDLVDTTGRSGWWRLEHCANDHNQFIAEGQTAVVAFLDQPPTPALAAVATGDPDPVLRGRTLTYTVDVTNISDAAGGTGGAAVDVTVTDVLPAGVSFQSCSWTDGAGTCSASAGTVTATRPSVHAGATRSLEVTVLVDDTATSPVTSSATVAFTDALGHPFGTVTTASTDTTVWSSNIGGEVCWAVADFTDQLLRVDRATGDVTVVGALGVPDVEGMAAHPTTGVLYAADADQLGTVDPDTGAFTALGSTLAPAVDVVGLAFHPFTGVLYGLDRVGGDDDLYTLDHTTGAVSSGPIDTDQAGALPGRDDLDDLAISPLDGTAYAIANNGSDDHLVIIDLVTGELTDLGIVQTDAGTRIQDIEGLSFAVDGTLLGSTGSSGGIPDALFVITPTAGAATPSTAEQVASFATGSNVAALACLTGAPNTVSGTVFEDRNGNGTFDAGEPTLGGVDVTLERAGVPMLTTPTGANGTYSLVFAATGDFTVVVDPADLDPRALTSPTTVAVAFGTATGETRTVDVWQRFAAISGTVWEDDDHDGIRDLGEPLLDGVPVTVWQDTDGTAGLDPATDTLVASTSTTSGTYEVHGLSAGEHVVEVDLIGEYAYTLQDQGADDSVDSDVDETTGRTGVITLAAGEQVTDVDAGLWQPGSITVTVYEDVDGDQTLTGGDALLGGVDVTLYADDGDGVFEPATDDLVAAGPVATAADGTVTFTGLEPGTYLTDVDDADAATQLVDATLSTGNDPQSVVVTSSTTDSATVGFYSPVSIGDLAWDDLDADGRYEPADGEPALDGATVNLRDAEGGVIATEVTGSGGTPGAYTFTGLRPGRYTVEFVAPAGSVLTVANAGADDTIDSDPVPDAGDPTRGEVPERLYVSGTNDDSLDAGFFTPAALAGRVFDDTDGDGVDDGEPGWGDVTVTLSADLDGDGTYTVVTSVQTDAVTGAYDFSDLRPGPYRVVVDTADLPDNVELTTDNQPLDVTLTSGQDLGDQDVGYRELGAVTGTVFEDLDGDGDPTGEAGTDGVTVELRLADGSLVASDVTDATGTYAFDLLAPGSYEVHVVDPTRYVLTTGNDPTTVLVALASTRTVDFGFQAYAPLPALTPDGAQPVEVGPTTDVEVVYPHTVTNAGNVADTYTLTTSPSAWPVALVLDADGDGVRDAGETLVVSDTGELAPGQSAHLFAVVTVPAGTAVGTTHTLTVTATSTVGPNDPTAPAITDSVTDTTTVIAPVLTVDKSSSLGGAPAVPGQRITYTVAVTNASGVHVTTATGVVLDDTLDDPAHGAFDPASFAIDGVDQADPTTFPLALPDLAPGQTVTVSFDLVLARPLPDGTVVTDLAAVTVDNPQLYEQVGADAVAVDAVTDAVSDVVASDPMPQLTKTATPTSGTVLAPGDAVTYRIVVTNLAEATESWFAVNVVEELPADGLTYVPGTTTVGGVDVADAAAGGSPVLVTNGGVDVGDLAPGASVTITLDLVVDDPVADGTTLTGVARATGANAGPLFGAVTHTVAVLPAVTLTPNGATTVEPDQQVVYAHLLTNTGNVTDSYALAVDSDTSFTVRVVDDLDGDGVLDVGEPDVTASRVLAPDESQRLLVVVDVPAGVPSGTVDTATVVATSTIDPVVVTQAYDVTTVVAGELQLVKTASPSSSAVNLGQVITYRLEVRNTGGADVHGVVLTDDTPSNVTYRPGTTRLDGVPVPDATGGDGNPLHSAVGGLSLGDLTPGATHVVTFAVAVRSSLPDGALVINVADATSTSGQSSTDSVSQIVTASAVLDLTKSASPAPGTVDPGTLLTYTVSVRNVGNATATGVRVFDEVPAHTSYVAGSTRLDGSAVADGPSGSSPLTAANGGVSLGSLGPGGAVREIRFQVRVNDPLPNGTVIENAASVTTAEGVNARSAPVRHTVEVTAGVELTPDNDTTVEPPGEAVHAHVATNQGTSTDTFLLDATSSQGWPVTLYRDDDRDGVWNLEEGTVVSSTGPLAPGGTFAFFAVVDVPDGAVPGDVDVTEVRATSTVDPVIRAEAFDTATVISASVSIAKYAFPSGDRVNAGQTVTYTVAVSNRGSASAFDVQVTDDAPSGTAYVPGSATLDGQPLPDEDNADGNPLSLANAGHTLAELPGGTVATFTFAAVVDAAATEGDTVTNVATLLLDDGTTQVAQRSHTVVDGPVLDVRKSATPEPPTTVTASQLISYRLEVTNLGSSPATRVVVADDTPLNTEYVPGSAAVDGVGVPDGATDPNPFSSSVGGYVIGDLAPGDDPVVLTFDVRVLGDANDGDVIHNAASATSDEGASAGSPDVIHDVEVNAGVALAPPRNVTGTAGELVVLAHTMTNTGESNDSYDLVATSSRGWPVRVVEDVDGDASLDAEDTDVVTTPLMAAGETFELLLLVEVPANATPGTIDTLRVRARSVEDPAVAGSVDDTVTIVAGALGLAKTASPSSLTPGTTATYTLTVRNDGTAPITGTRLFDTTPEGTRYVRGSTTRDGTAVSDIDGGTPLSAGLALGELAPGATRVVTFQVVAETDPARTVVINVAEVVADDQPAVRAGTVQPYRTDLGIDITAGTRQEVAPGTTVVYPHRVTNVGDLPDEVVVSTASSLGFDTRLVIDENGDGGVDDDEPEVSGALPLAAGEGVDLLAVVVVPGDAAAGLEDTLEVRATSLTDSTIVVTAVDTTVVTAAVLQVIKSSQPAAVTEPGGLVRFGIAVTNVGTEVARDVVLIDPLPPGTTYVPGTTVVDGEAIDDVDGLSPVDPGVGGLALGDLEVGASRIVLFDVEVRLDVAPGAVLTNVATVRSARTDPQPSSPVALTVAGRTQLDIAKSAAVDRVAPDGTVRWTLVVRNVGSVSVLDVLLTDVLGPELTYVPGSTTLDGQPVGDGVASGAPVAIGELAPEQSRTISFDTRVGVLADGTILQNSATVTNGATGIEVASNAATVTVDPRVQGLPQTGLGTGRTLGAAASFVAAGWALLYVARPERRPRPVLQRRTRA